MKTLFHFSFYSHWSPVDSPGVVEGLLGGSGVGQGGLHIGVELLWASVNWWHIWVGGHSGGVWKNESVLQLLLGELEVLVVVSDIVINSKVWHEVVHWVDWLNVVKWWWVPGVTVLDLSIGGKLEGSLNVLILAEVWNWVVHWMGINTLTLVVGQEAVASLLGGGASWVTSEELDGSWGVMVVVSVSVAHRDGRGASNKESNSFEHFN